MHGKKKMPKKNSLNLIEKAVLEANRRAFRAKSGDKAK
jgi:hypothetical protein